MGKYIFSERINPAKTLLALPLVSIAAYFMGWLYSALSEFCTFIILDFFILIGTIVTLALISAAGCRIGAVRNKIVKVTTGLVVSLVAWYSSWVYLVNSDNMLAQFFSVGDTFSGISYYLDNHSYSIGSMGRSSSGTIIDGGVLWTFAGIEALLFLVPVLFSSTITDYYCEDCEKFNKTRDIYVEDASDAYFLSAEQTGDFTAIDKFSSKAAVPQASQIGDYSKQIYKVELSWCEHCKKNGVINVNRGVYSKDNKDNVTFKNETTLIENTLMSDHTVAVILKTNP